MEPTAPQINPQTNPQAGSNFTASDGTPLNPTAATLTRAIRQVESGGNYNAVGDNGDSAGAYQFNNGKTPIAPGDIPQNFKSWATQYGFNPNDFSPVNQDKVAYTRIDSLLKKGYTQSEVAALWNGAKMVNGKPQAINPEYVSKVQAAYQQMAEGLSHPPVQTDASASIGYTAPQPPSQVAQNTNAVQGYAPPTPPAQMSDIGTNAPAPAAPENLWQKAGDVASGIGNFLFPAVGDVSNLIQGKNTKTPLQIAGDVGLTALPFIPGLGEVADIGRAGEAVAEGGGLLSKLAELPTVVKGAGVGYGAGVASNLSQGQGLGQAFMPNAGTIGGALTGGIASAVIPRLLAPFTRNLTEQGAIDATIGDLSKNLKTAPAKRLLNSLPGGGANELRLMATGGMLPDVLGTDFNVANARDITQGRISALGQLRAQALDSINKTHSLDEIAQEAAAKAGSSPLTPEAEAALTPATKSNFLRQKLSGTSEETATHIQSIVDNIKKTIGKDNLTTSELEAFKEAQAGLSKKYARAGQIGASDARSFLADVARNRIEKTANESGLPNMGVYNKYIQQHYNILKILSRFESQKVKGGMLGNMLRARTGDVLGGVVGNTLAPGVGGTLLGALSGEMGSNLVSKIIGDTSLSNPLRDALISNIEKQDPQIVQQFLGHAGQTGQVAPVAIPKSTKIPGLIGNLLTKAAIRGGVSLPQ